MEETIENYLRNKLTPSERVAFEKKLSSDAALKNETDLERSIINAIQKARVNELKAVLNKVDVSKTNSLFTKRNLELGAGTVVGILLLLYLFSDQSEPTKKQNIVNSITQGVRKNNLESNTSKPKEPIAEKSILKPIKENPKQTIIQSNKDQNKVVAIPIRPTIQALDPTKEFETQSVTEPSVSASSKTIVSIANISVEMDSSDKKYTFHYKFHKGKLILYGSFDKSLYEILEINGEKKVVFLYYKEKYYLLDENQKKVKTLEPIQDAALIEKLNDYRQRTK